MIPILVSRKLTSKLAKVPNTAKLKDQSQKWTRIAKTIQERNNTKAHKNTPVVKYKG